MSKISLQSGVAENAETGYWLLQKKLLRICIANFFILALVGLLLRAYPLFPVSFLAYKNILHAHSHFAFGGWIMPVLLLLILQFFPQLRSVSAYKHWQRIIILVLVSAYGMLLSFPFQGYDVVSIIFSTLSIFAGFYAGLLIHRSERKQLFLPSWSFLQAGFIYFFLSAAGPFATGPLIANGMAGTDIYYNAIYFYLHFQYNGFFTFIILAVLYRIIEKSKPFNNGREVFQLLNIACLPAYALSVLWTQPSMLVNIIGGAAALLQLVAIIFLLKDLKGIKWRIEGIGWMLSLAFVAFVVKSVLQLVSAFPLVAQLAYQNRNFVIAYLHLVLIGFVSMFVCAILFRSMNRYRAGWFNRGIFFFVFAFASTELLMIIQASGFLHWLPGRVYTALMLILSILFPVGLGLIGIAPQKLRQLSPIRSL